MKKQLGWILSGLFATLGMALVLATPVQSQRPLAKETLGQRLARLSESTEQQADRFLAVLGPALQEELKSGNEVKLQGLGTLRIVRIPEHKDMATGGRPIIVPATNTVEFLAEEAIAEAANASAAVPAAVVPQYEQPVLPGQTPGQKVGRTRVPSTRIR
jgi:nucleoid DNA-binding protein